MRPTVRSSGETPGQNFIRTTRGRIPGSVFPRYGARSRGLIRRSPRQRDAKPASPSVVKHGTVHFAISAPSNAGYRSAAGSACGSLVRPAAVRNGNVVSKEPTMGWAFIPSVRVTVAAMYCGDKAAGIHGQQTQWSHRARTPSGCGSRLSPFGNESGAGDETRTRDVLLGKEVLYH